MRKLKLAADLERPAATNAERRRGPFPDAVHCQYHGLVERRGVEGAGRMALMMFREQQTIASRDDAEPFQLAHEKLLLKQLLADPDRQRHREAAVAARRKCEV